MNSPLIKRFGECRIEDGESLIVVDLAECSGMDSTFMGTLAGMASRLSAADGGVLQVAGADERNQRSLEDLGLDFLMQINPEAAPWEGELEEIRCALEPVEADPVSQMQRAKLCLEAHEKLSDLSDKNAREFDQVVGTLRKQISDEPKSES